MNELEKRVIDISYYNKLSHIGSCIGEVNILDYIYSIKKPDEKVVLSNGHSHLAHLVVREKYEDIDINELLKHGIHCERLAGCDVSTGSLGQGLPIAVGLALADRSKNVYCTITDGECAEGSIWEALRIASELELNNLKIYCIANGWSGYKEIDLDLLEKRLKDFFPVTFLRVNTGDLSWHYKVLKEDEYRKIIGD